MIVMPSNNSGIRVGYLAGKHPGRIGWLISPGGWRTPPEFMPVALDNGAFVSWTKRKPWDVRSWLNHLDKAVSECRPLWAVAPDVVTDKVATIEKWHAWETLLRQRYPSIPLAFAVQDGMRPSDVPSTADLIFVGGSTDWKWSSLPMWSNHFAGRMHVARVNGEGMLWRAHEAGAISCDGTGWFRGDQNQLAGLHRYLDESDSGMRQPPRFAYRYRARRAT